MYNVRDIASTVNSPPFVYNVLHSQSIQCSCDIRKPLPKISSYNYKECLSQPGEPTDPTLYIYADKVLHCLSLLNVHVNVVPSRRWRMLLSLFTSYIYKEHLGSFSRM